MPRIIQGQRQRACKPKTKSGSRRIKCDEQRPSCKKCTIAGRTCDGYALDSIFSQTAFPLSRASLLTSSSPKIILNPSPSLGTTRETHSFNFFISVTSPQLSGFFGEDIWDRLILQTSHFEPAIRHAIIALGSLHEVFVKSGGLICGKGREDEYMFAWGQYGRAMRGLMEGKGERRVDVCMVACVLFACFESMQGSYAPAIKHVRSGTKILYEMQRDGDLYNRLEVSESPYVSIDVIEDMFFRLDFQVSQMIDDYEWSLYNQTIRSRQIDPTPSTFSSLAQARRTFILNWHRTSYGLHELGQNLNRPDFDEMFDAWHTQALEIVNKWSSAFDTFLSHHQNRMSENEKKGVAILRILRDVGSTSIRIQHSHDGQMVWDAYCPMYKEIVRLSSEIISSATVPRFSLDMGVIAPLYEVVARCREPSVRREAIALLKSAKMQEGPWNSTLAAIVAERIVAIEEAGLGEVGSCTDIPDSVRLSNAHPVFDPAGRKATLNYSKVGKDGGERQLFKEVIEW